MANMDTVSKFVDAINRHDLGACASMWASDAEIH